MVEVKSNKNINTKKTIVIFIIAFFALLSLLIYKKQETIVWIKPPLYTNIEDIELSSNRANNNLINVHESSKIYVYTQNLLDLLFIKPYIKIENQSYSLNKIGKSSFELQGVKFNFKNRICDIKVKYGWLNIFSKKIKIIKNLSPTVNFVGKYLSFKTGDMEVKYSYKDDYDLEAIWVEVFKNNDINNKLLKPDIKMSKDKISFNLSDSIWAGQDAYLRLVVKDKEGVLGKTKNIPIKISQKTFSNKMSKRIIDIRKNLIEFPEKKSEELKKVLSILKNKEIFNYSKNVFLALKTVSNILQRDFLEDDIKEISQILWDISVYLEDGDISFTKENLFETVKEIKLLLKNNNKQRKILSKIKTLETFIEYHLQELFKLTIPTKKQKYKVIVSSDNVDASVIFQSLEIIKKFVLIGNIKKAKNLFYLVDKKILSLASSYVVNISEDEIKKADKLTFRLQNLIRNQELIKQSLYEITMNKNPKKLKKLLIYQEQMRYSVLNIKKDLKQKFALDLVELEKSSDQMQESFVNMKSKKITVSIENQLKALAFLRKAMKKSISGIIKSLVKKKTSKIHINPFERSKDVDPLGRNVLGLKKITSEYLPTYKEQEDLQNILININNHLNNLDIKKPQKNYLQRLLNDL